MKTKPFVLALSALLALSSAASRASADETPAEPPPRSVYGYQTLADGASVLGGIATTGILFVPRYVFSVVGTARSAFAAIFVDAAVLTRDDAPPRRQRMFTISPSIRFFGKEKTLGLAGMW